VSCPVLEEPAENPGVTPTMLHGLSGLKAPLLFRQNAKTILSVPSSWINKILNKNKYSIAFGSKTMFDYPQLSADSPVRPSHDRSLCFSVHHYSMAVRSQAGPSDLGP